MLFSSRQHWEDKSEEAMVEWAEGVRAPIVIKVHRINPHFLVLLSVGCHKACDLKQRLSGLTNITCPLNLTLGTQEGASKRVECSPFYKNPYMDFILPHSSKEPKPGRPGFDVQFCLFNMEGSLYNPWIWCPSPHAGLVPASWKAPFKCMQTQAPYIPLFCHT